MHFAFPPRKTSNPPPYAPRSSRAPLLRIPRNKRVLAVIALGVIALFYLLSSLFSGPSVEHIPAGTPNVVLVTTFASTKGSAELADRIKANRKDYASRHGYATFFTSTTEYNLGNHAESWAKVPAVRHAMTKYPHSTFFWYLDESAVIMDPTRSVETHIMEKSRLETLMMVNVPVVPPDSVIRTFAHLHGDRIDLVLTQDKEGLTPASFIIRRGDWAKYFLDAWFDPLYRTYNFQKAETHALEHIIQWHGTMLAKLALVPQKIMNSYTRQYGAKADELYAEGDFVASFYTCLKNAKRDCKQEIVPLLEQAERNYATTTNS